MHNNNNNTQEPRRYHLEAPFHIQFYFGSKFCPSVLETLGFRVPARYIRDISMFNVCSSSKNCPSARYASAANVCRKVDVFAIEIVSLNNIP
jgi:hypothetical protein